MTPSPATVMRLRYFVRVGCRVLGMICVLGGFLNLNHLAEVLLGAAQGAFGSLGVGAILAALIPPMSLVGPGLMVFFFAHRLSKWLVPMPANRCPYCDYPLGAVEDDRCPECGLVLGRVAAPMAVISAPARSSAPPAISQPGSRSSAAPPSRQG